MALTSRLICEVIERILVILLRFICRRIKGFLLF